MRGIIFGIVITLFFEAHVFGIINGKPLEEIEDRVPTRAITGITLKVEGLADDPCSASWLTSDTLITASHCFLLNDYLTTLPKICLSPNPTSENANNPENCLSHEEYEVISAPQVSKGTRAPTRKLKKVVTIQIPDIVLVKIKSKNFVESHPHETLPLAPPPATSEISLEKTSLIVLGQGCPLYPATRFAKPEGLGIFRWQTLNEIIPDKEGNVISHWKADDIHGASCWGDSGGPLLLENHAGIGLRGVISGIKRTLDYDQGKTTASISLYADLFHPKTAQWLREQLPAPTMTE